MEQLAAHAANLGAQGWMIARDGFTPDALSYAGQARILVSSGEDWARIVRLVK